jgi:hypothetical protein
MADLEDPSPLASDPASSDAETITQTSRERGGADDTLQGAGEDRNGEEHEEGGAAVELKETRDGGNISNRYREIMREQQEDGSELSSVDAGSVDAIPRMPGSPVESVSYANDDTPSMQVRSYSSLSQANYTWHHSKLTHSKGSYLSSPGSSVLPSVASRPGLSSPTPSFRPFDRRFQSRISSPHTHSPRSASPAFLSSHSRHASLSSNFQLDQADVESQTPPWEVVRWTRLNKLNGQAFSEAGKRNFGSPTCMFVSASIVLGTSKGVILVFDYNQNLKMIIGSGTKGKMRTALPYSYVLRVLTVI